MAEEHADKWIVAVGASGGEGLSDIRALLQALGRAPQAVIMVVLHRPFDYPSELREVLASSTDMPVVIAMVGDKLETGIVYIGDPAAHLTLVQGGLAGITEDRKRTHRNRTVDLLFRSVAEHAGSHCVGVVLAGGLDDGSRGLEAIHEAGGKTMALLRSPPRPGMPENAIGFNGPIDYIGTVEEIARQILALISHPPSLAMNGHC